MSRTKKALVIIMVGYSKPPPRPERGRDCQPSRLARRSTVEASRTPKTIFSFCVVYASLIPFISSPHKMCPGLCRAGEHPARVGAVSAVVQVLPPAACRNSGRPVRSRQILAKVLSFSAYRRMSHSPSLAPQKLQTSLLSFIAPDVMRPPYPF